MNHVHSWTMYKWTNVHTWKPCWLWKKRIQFPCSHSLNSKFFDNMIHFFLIFVNHPNIQLIVLVISTRFFIEFFIELNKQKEKYFFKKEMFSQI